MFEPSPERLRAALGRFATGVTIVTARAADGAPVGLTANSFNSVSLQPPLVLWSLALSSRALPVFQTATHFAIHVLGAQQQALAERFARRDVDRWAGVAWTPGAGGAPLLPQALAVFECRCRSRYPEGDHIILVGEVLRCQHGDATPALLYHGGRFHTGPVA
ncbi:p-hydroxyphenylacetate 3-hydroxylase, reductase component [Tepidimonas thermarum]|uniref:p-hydroxyphenylacetate 3-hydroxylase, reductase component n=1 Tax=Tepidimonas thermarum TaxID=335431 RepID=A0A554X472_9BURK|nr:flavin reductase family protein [Tepidimonas thermarum]TSE30637.1 p-hydroxyphenylacetate 3-hydroxylase, reductase component [Tepidimonas thermarum]